MKYEIGINGKVRLVEIAKDAAGSLQFRIDGREVNADVAGIEVDSYSILLEGQSFLVRVEKETDGSSRATSGGHEFLVAIRDPRAWRGAQGALLSTEGRQQVAAPMPGKVVRVLVREGDAVEAGQGLAVVEAMKMQNEIRAPKAGTVEKVLVKDEQTIAAGQVMVMIS